MVSIPQINITPPRGARQESTQDVYNAFRMQMEGESNRQSPLQSFTQGVGAVQQVVQGQQAIQTNQQSIELNELEKERRELALNLQREQQAEDIAFTQAIKTGDLNEQTNALLSTPPQVLQRNKDAALAVADRIRYKGSPEQAEIIEQEVMPVIDRERIERQKAQEAKAIQDREDFKFQEGERRESARQRATNSRMTPEEQKLAEDKLQLERETLEVRRQELKSGTSGQTGTVAPVSKLEAVRQEQNDLINFTQQNPRTRRLSQALEMRSRKISEEALATGQDEAVLQKKLNSDFLNSLDTGARKEFRDRTVKAAVQAAEAEARTAVPAGTSAAAGAGALAGMEGTTATPSATSVTTPEALKAQALEERVVGAIKSGAITQDQLNTQARQAVAEYKALARRENRTVKLDDAALFRKAVELILAGLKPNG